MQLPWHNCFSFSSGVAGVSASNLASMDPRPSTASGQHGLSGQTAQEPAEAESCTGNAPVPARGNKWCRNFRWFFASQIHFKLGSASRWKSHSCVTVFTILLPVWARKKFLRATSISKCFFSVHLKVAFARLLSAHRSAHTHTHTHTHTHAPADTADNGSHPSGWQSRQKDYLSPCSRQGKPSNSMLFSLKAAKTVSKHPPLLLTHTNIILHNSADPGPAVHILLLAVGSVRVITPTGDTYGCNAGLKKYDPALLFTSTLLSLSSINIYF